MVARTFTPQQDETIAAEYAAGVTLKQLVARYGGSTVSVRSAIRRGGGQARTAKEAVPGSALAKGDPEARAEALRLYTEGWSVKRLSKHFGCNTRVVTALLSEQGVTLHIGGKLHPALDTEEKCQDAARRYAAGESINELQRVYGCAHHAMRAALVRGGATIREPGGLQVWTEEIAAAAADAYRGGESQASISRRLGIGQSNISRKLRELGVPIRPSNVGPRERHPSWKGGRIVTEGGYVLVSPAPEDLAFCKPNSSGYALEHRLVMGRYLGRPVYEWETVHHKDGDHSNNDITNLQLRIGAHGKGVALRCSACGSQDLQPIEI